MNLTINCINKVKIEQYEEFEDSIFLEVYEKAARHTGRIIEEQTQTNTALLQLDTFLNQESYNNIIPFLGDRGVGKSSAMVSYALFLQKYNTLKGKLAPEFNLTNKDVQFYLLPRIDAAMLIKGENLLDIVLAFMWKIFNEKQMFGNKQEIVKKGFLKIKNSYELYVETISGKEKKSIVSVKDLKDLSRCLNLAQDFKELVDLFLPCVTQNGCGNSYLVITLDDLDTATEDVYLVLEQIRLFLMLPNIILLVSADLERLYLECSKYFLNKLYVNGMTSDDMSQMKGYARSYLSKMFPSNRRIYMPDINIDNEQEYQIKIPQFDLNVKQGIKKTIYKLIYQNTGIMLFPFKTTSTILQYRTLREIVNVLYLFETVAQLDNPQKRSQEMVQWLISRMEDYTQTINNLNIYNCLKDALNAEFAYMNDIVLKLQKDTSNEIKTRYSEEFDYEMMLRILYEYSEQNELESEVWDFLVLLYSLRLKRLCEDKELFSEKVSMKGIWRAAVNLEEKNTEILGFPWDMEEKEEPEISPDKIQLKELELKYDKSNSFDEWLLHNKQKVMEIFSIALFCDLNLWSQKDSSYVKYRLREIKDADDEQLIQGTNETKEVSYYFSLEEDYTEASIDHFFKNMLVYEECLQGFLNNLNDAFNESNSTSGKLDLPQTLFDNEKYKLWKDKYKIHILKDVLPLEHVEIMNELTIAIRNTAPVRKKDNMTVQAIDRICRQLERIIDVLKRVDKYYDIEENSYGIRVAELYNFWKNQRNCINGQSKSSD